MARQEGEEKHEKQFSRWRIFKKGLQNMKDDVDPVYKGGKAGLLALHGIPTWVREHREGKLSPDSKGWAIVSGVAVGGALATAYVLGAVVVSPAILGVPVAAQGISYAREAFRRARKSEYEGVVMTKVRKTFTQSDGEYDLTCNQMIEGLAGKLYDAKEKGVKQIIKDANDTISSLEESLSVVENADDMHSVKKHETIKEYKSRIGGYKDQITELEKALECYKEKSVIEAKQGFVHLMEETFDGVFADNKVGKKYEMNMASLKVGPKKRRSDRNRELCYQDSPTLNETKIIAEMIQETVEASGGSANIEAFGQLSAVYGKKLNDENHAHYNVIPNRLWKKK